MNKTPLSGRFRFDPDWLVLKWPVILWRFGIGDESTFPAPNRNADFPTNMLAIAAAQRRSLL
jgi:hypothetical protein